MKRFVLSALSLLAIAAVGDARADNFVTGQTGQYHLLPETVDTQKITLVGRADPACQFGLGLFLVDEWGKVDTVRFSVPFATVFLLTDLDAIGHNPYACKGCLAEIDIYSTYESYPEARAKFILPTPLIGTTNEVFGGSRSLASGIAYPVNSSFCAFASYAYGTADGTTNLDHIVVHGTVVTNHRTTAAPWLTW